VPSALEEEILFSVERARRCLESLVVRGLSSVAPEALGELRMLHGELERVGASHLAERLSVLAERIEGAERDAPKFLLMAQTSLRVFERVLTLEAARTELERLANAREEPAS